MNRMEFINKYNIKERNEDLLAFLDRLYLEFTMPQAQQMIEDYFLNADEIYNDVK